MTPLTRWLLHSTAIILLVLLEYCGQAPQQREDGQQHPITIADVKLHRKPDNVRQAEQATYQVEGYFYKDPVPMLLTDAKWARINAKMPDSVFITLGGDVMTAINNNPNEYQGAFIRLTGRINNSLEGAEAFQDMRGKRIQRINADFILSSPPQSIRPRTSSFVIPASTDICKLNPRLCRMSNAPQNNYALLYAGGIDIQDAHARYWNDLKFMYNTLKSQYGYDDNHIVVVYKDGQPEDGDMAVDYPANANGFDQAIQYLNGRLNDKVNLFVFVTNHGGGYNTGDGLNYGGLPDKVPLDEIDPYKMDETTFFYQPVQSADLDQVTLSDDDFSAKMNMLRCKKMTILFEQCFSGGFLRDMRGPGRVLMSAATEFEFSWSGAPYDHDLFAYYFTAALNKSTVDGIPVDADTNHDGRVSMLEAFLYAKGQDNANESPQLEDTGDGVGTGAPQQGAGQGGNLAAMSFLNE